MVIARDVGYDVDGVRMRGRLALPDGEGRRPGVLIAHEANGLDEFERSKAERMAELGYVAFALDYHGGGRIYDDADAMFGRLRELEDLDYVRGLARAGLDVLTAEPRTDPDRIAAVGYCFGGTMVLELARAGADLKAVVGFHPGLTPSRPEDSPNITGRVLMCVGTEDPFVTAEHRAAFEEDMRAAGVDWRLNSLIHHRPSHHYGGAGHCFTHPRAADAGHPPGVFYHRPTDERSWRAMLDLFSEVFA